MFSSNDEIYSALKEISEDFKSEGKSDIAQRIDDAMCSGCTSGEVLGDIFMVLTDLKREGWFVGKKNEYIVNAMIKVICAVL